MFFATLPDPSRSGDVLMAFLSILFEGAPYILIGTILSGLIDAFLPSKFLEKLLPKNRVAATFAAGFLGLIFPVCECAVVPVVRRLVQKGLPLSCGLAYLLSAPIINPIVVISTLTAFKEFQNVSSWDTIGNATMTIARITLAYVVAVGFGIFLIKKKPSQILTPAVAASVERAAAGGVQAGPQGFDAKITHAMRTAMRDFLDTAMYFAIGVLLTSIFNTQVPQSSIQGLAENEWFAVPTMMGLSFVLALCSTSDAFIAAPMDVFSNASKLAFLVFGPMLDIKLVFMYASIFRRKFLIIMSLVLFIAIGVLCEPWIHLITLLENKSMP